MYIKQVFSVCFGVVILCLPGRAQLLPDPKIVSPNSASIDRFTEIPVDLFTGSPQINIPIHTLEYGSIKVPIALRYNPSSVMPAQQPGWVGLGWDLQSFGAITRRLRGYNDDVYGDPGSPITEPVNSLNAYYPVPGNTFALSGSDLANLSNWSAGSQLYADFSSSAFNSGGVNDMQADEFSFNFMGYSGTFYYEGTTRGWVVASKDNIKVQLTGGNNGFLPASNIITAIGQYKEFAQTTCALCQPLGDSWQPNQFNGFTLTVPDGTQYTFGGQNAMEFDCDYRYNVAGSAETFTFWANTWLLTKIVDPTNHEVDFTYQRTWPTCNLSFSGSYFQFLANSNGCTSGDLISGNLNNTTHSGLYQWPMYLSTISSPNETITFNIGDATCLRYPDAALSSQTSDGALTSGGTSPPDHVFLTLINAQTSNLRWEQLNNIVVKNSAGSVYQQYAFGYSSSATQRLTLDELTEEDNAGSPVKQYQLAYNNVALLPAAMDGDQTDAWGYYNGNTVNGSGLPAVYALKLPNPSLATVGLLTQITWPTGGNTQLSWEPHDYSQVVTTARNGVTAPTSTPATAGGCRVKEITSYDASSHVLLDKKYYYRRGYTVGATPGSLVSSGILNGTPVFYFQVNNRVSYGGTTNVSFTIGSLNSIGAYGYNGNGSYIGYDEVAEVNADGSYTRHFFTSYPADVNGVSHYDNLPDGSLGWVPGDDTYMPMSTLDLERGKPIQYLDYTSTGVLVRNILYTYRSDAARFSSSAHLIDLGQVLGCNQGDALVFTTAREQYGYEYYPVGKSVTAYDQNGNNPVVSSESYTYNVNNLISSKTTTNSNGESVVTAYTYPTDYTDATSTAMVAAHILSPSIQTVTTVGGVQQSLEHINYYNPSAGLFAVQNVQEQVAANSIETRQVFYQYDAKGNPQEFSKANDIHAVYLWSYNGEYPVVRITGSTLSQVTAIVSQATLDAACTPGNDAAVRTLLQTLRSQLPGALVSTYTYLPGVGMTSETDARGRVTFYNYDSFQRLLSVTDNDGNIIKTYNYQYEHP